MIDTIIFDLDGTLLYTLEDLKNSLNFVLEKYGYEIKSTDEVKNFVGSGVARLIELSLPEGCRNKDFNKCICDFKEHYAQNMYSNTKPYENIISMLEALNRHGFKLGVVSNKFDKAVKILCKKYFPGLITEAIGESDKIRKKPHPDGIFETIKKLNSTCEKTVYVGDSEVDIQTAQNTGIACVSVLWGYKDRDFLTKNGAQHLISTPYELIEIITRPGNDHPGSKF